MCGAWFFSTCAVHEVILDDRPLDETHPLWPTSHYGAHKAALEAFVHSYGLGQGWPICALRPTGIYGPRDTEFLDIFKSIKNGVLPVTGDGESQVTLVYGPDAARACIRAIDADVPSGSTFFLTDGGTYAQRAMMETVEHALGKRATFTAP